MDIARGIRDPYVPKPPDWSPKYGRQIPVRSKLVRWPDHAGSTQQAHLSKHGNMDQFHVTGLPRLP